MQPTLTIVRPLLTLAAGAVAAAALAAPASAQLKAGEILVVDPDVPPVSTAVLFQVDPETGARTVIADFGGSSPSAVAVERGGGVLVTDTAAGTDPSGGTNEWGALYRLSPDPATGALTRTVLTDFGVGASTGRNPRAVTMAPDGQIIVLNGNGGTGDRAVLVRVDPATGARAVVSDFGNGGQGALGVEPRGVAVDAGGRLIVVDAQAGSFGLGALVQVDPVTGVRISLSDFGAGANPGSNPTSVAVERDGRILVTDEGHPSTTPLGLLFRVELQSGLRTVLSDFNAGANLGREPEGVALEADGRILVVDKHAGPFTRGMLFRVDPQTGARAILSDFGAGANQGGDPLALAAVPHGTVIVVSEVVNDNGGTAVASDWTTTVTGGDPVPASFPGAGAPGTTVILDPGAYAVSDTGPAGYTSTLSTGCAGIIAAAETKTCTITHDDQPATLVVVNEVVNDNGGSAVASDWTTMVTGANAAPASFPGARAPGTTVTLDAGFYSVIANGPPGYDNTRSIDCGGTIAIGESRTCTITSDDQPATLVVVNEVVNDDGGSAVPGDFSITVTGGDPSPASFAGQGVPGTAVTLDAGGYSVGVTGPPGYTSTSSPDCAATIGLAETRTCTITSDDRPPPVPTCAGKVATIVGTAGPTELLGTAGDDVIVDLDGDNVVRGRGGNDTVCTGPGNDRIFVAGGADTVVDAGGRNSVEGGAGRDAITTGDGDDQVDGGGGNDTVVAGGGANVVDGQGGNDTITTGADDDRIDGGVGFDRCTPGAAVNIVRRCEVVS